MTPLATSRVPVEPCGLEYAGLSSLSDEDVMAHLAAGHGDAIAVLFDRFGRLVFSVAMKLVRDAGEAEDVTQEVFVDLCRTAAQFDGAKGTTKMWIIRAASRRAMNRRRHLNFRHFYSSDEITDDLLLAAEPDRSVLPSMSIPEARRLTREMLATVDTAQRRVLELVYFEGLSMQEVAERTGDTLDSVRHRYYRGLQRMRRVLGKSSEGPKTEVTGETLDANA